MVIIRRGTIDLSDKTLCYEGGHDAVLRRGLQSLNLYHANSLYTAFDFDTASQVQRTGQYRIGDSKENLALSSAPLDYIVAFTKDELTEEGVEDLKEYLDAYKHPGIIVWDGSHFVQPLNAPPQEYQFIRQNNKPRAIRGILKVLLD